MNGPAAQSSGAVCAPVNAASASADGAECSRRERALARCRSAEALYYDGRREAAIEEARAAIAAEPEAEEVLDFCGWLFSNCGEHREAAAVYEAMLAQRARWAEGHRHASGSYAAIGDHALAISHAERASELAPASREYALHAASLLEGCGRAAEAVSYVERAAAIAPEDGLLARRLSALLWEAGQQEKAVDEARRAMALLPEECPVALHAVELLLRSDRLAEAATAIRAAAARHETDPAAFRLLSEVEMRLGASAAALAAIERALALAPNMVEYHLHRGNILYRLGDFAAAAEGFGRAARIDPENEAAKRSQLTACLDGGKVTEALAIGGELIRAAPDNENYAEALMETLRRRFATLDGDYVVVGDGRGQSLRLARPAPSLGTAFATQRRVLGALVVRETRTRFAEAKLGYGWALIEPVLHILMLSLAFAVLMHGQPPLGHQFFIFYYTGLIPYHMFAHTSSNLAFSISSNDALLQLPLVTTLDVVVARGVLEFVTDAVVAVILLGGFNAIGLQASPHNLLGAAAALAACWLFACGCGIVNAVIGVFFKSWDKIWVQLVRTLYFASGIFYVTAGMPDWVRAILVWNPVLQAVEWFRSSFFEGYHPPWLSPLYLLSVALATLFAGIALERRLRPHLREPS